MEEFERAVVRIILLIVELFFWGAILVCLTFDAFGW